MSVTIHFINGNDLSIQAHYNQKEYRNDVIVEIDNLFYEVYFFTDGVLKYEMRKDGFFSFLGLIILEEISNETLINAIEKLLEMKYFEHFVGKKEMPLNSRFMQHWYANDMRLTGENIYSHKLR